MDICWVNETGKFKKEFFEKLKTGNIKLPERLNENTKINKWYIVCCYGFSMSSGIEIRKYYGEKLEFSNHITVFLTPDGVKACKIINNNFVDVTEEDYPPFINELMDIFYDKEKLTKIDEEEMK